MRAIQLDRNENHYGPSPACLDALRNIAPALLHDYTRDFQRGVYSELSERLGRIHGVDAKRVVLGYGCEDLLKQAVHHLLGAGERCFVPSASWWYYGAIAGEVGGVTVRYPLRETETCYCYDVDALLDLHRRMRATVLLDEAYWGFVEPAVDHARLTAEYPNLLVLRTFSKLYGLAGARIGYGIAGRGLGGFLKFAGRYLGYSRVSEQLALAALGSPDYYDAVRRKMSADGRRFIDQLRRFEGVRAYDTAANFLLVRFPAQVAGPLRAALAARGLFPKFLDEPDFQHCARISLGTEQENAELGAAFEELLPKLIGRARSPQPT